MNKNRYIVYPTDDPQMKSKEKWHSFSTKLEYTRLKLIFGTLVSVALIVTIGYIVYGTFQRILYSLDELSTPRQETLIVHDLVTEISEVQNYAGTYSITFKTDDLKGYLYKRKEAHKLIDSLRLVMGEKDYYEKVDSLHFLFTQYVESLNEWLVLKSANPKDVMRQVYETIEEGDSSLIDAVKNIPRSKITTVTTTVERPLNTVVETKEELKEDKNKSFFKRFFGTGKAEKEQEKIPAKKEVVRREVVTETKVQVDTNYYHKVDTLLLKMKASLNRVEEQKNDYARRLKQREIQLLENNLVLVNRVNQLLKNINQEEQVLAHKKINESKATAHEAYLKLAVLTIVGGMFTLIFVVLVFTDISKSLHYKRMLQKSMMEAQKLAKVKEEFLANMSHEIRTPLNSIIGFVDQLNASGLKGEKVPPINVLESSSQHLLNLVNDILDYSKIDSGALRLEQIGFEVEDVVKEVFYVLKPAADVKGIALNYIPQKNVREVLSGDPVRLKQLLINLIGNGIKFTDKGSVSLFVDVEKNSSDHCLLKCRVVDTGIGIDKAKIPNIFTEFSQADTSITRKYGGTGLGLSICKKLTDLQEGHIAVESELGKGTVFSFEIPYPRGVSNEYRVKQKNDYGNRLELKGKRILIVDDDEMNTLLLKPVFHQWQMLADFNADSTQAWLKLQQETYDLVILDLQMPVMDGWELINRIKFNLHSLNVNTPVLVCTANVLLNEEKLNKDKLASGVLYKPFRYAELWNAMATIFQVNAALDNQEGVEMEESFERPYSLQNFMTFAGNDPDQVAQFIRTFISCSKSDLEQIAEGLENKNHKLIGELSHKLKNTCGQLEAVEVLKILHRLEQLVDHTHLPGKELKELVQRLEKNLNVLFSLLEKELQEIQSSSQTSRL